MLCYAFCRICVCVCVIVVLALYGICLLGSTSSEHWPCVRIPPVTRAPIQDQTLHFLSCYSSLFCSFCSCFFCCSCSCCCWWWCYISHLKTRLYFHYLLLLSSWVDVRMLLFLICLLWLWSESQLWRLLSFIAGGDICISASHKIGILLLYLWPPFLVPSQYCAFIFCLPQSPPLRLFKFKPLISSNLVSPF